MKILFISNGTFPDYQCDMLFHGLRSRFGHDVVDASRIAHMYRADMPEGSAAKAALYGKGFTLFGLLESDDAVDRDDIGAKIAKRYFDFVIFGSIRRCQAFIQDVFDHYPSDRIAFVDGEDDQLVAAQLLGRGLYFKRELNAPGPGVMPIHFAIPAEKISQSIVEKTRAQASIDPSDIQTYIYNTEDEYYGGYANSLFGLTKKKAGWDCLRHYEIMANGCIPNFEGLEACPPWTMVPLPKFELIEARTLLQQRGAQFFMAGEGRDIWNRLNARIRTILHSRLTTESLAASTMDTMLRQTDEAPLLSGGPSPTLFVRT